MLACALQVLLPLVDMPNGLTMRVLHPSAQHQGRVSHSEQLQALTVLRAIFACRGCPFAADEVLAANYIQYHYVLFLKLYLLPRVRSAASKSGGVSAYPGMQPASESAAHRKANGDRSYSGRRSPADGGISGRQGGGSPVLGDTEGAMSHAHLQVLCTLAAHKLPHIRQTFQRHNVLQELTAELSLECLAVQHNRPPLLTPPLPSTYVPSSPECNESPGLSPEPPQPQTRRAAAGSAAAGGGGRRSAGQRKSSGGSGGPTNNAPSATSVSQRPGMPSLKLCSSNSVQQQALVSAQKQPCPVHPILPVSESSMLVPTSESSKLGSSSLADNSSWFTTPPTTPPASARHSRRNLASQLANASSATALLQIPSSGDALWHGSSLSRPGSARGSRLGSRPGSRAGSRPGSGGGSGAPSLLSRRSAATVDAHESGSASFRGGAATFRDGVPMQESVSAGAADMLSANIAASPSSATGREGSLVPNGRTRRNSPATTPKNETGGASFVRLNQRKAAVRSALALPGDRSAAGAVPALDVDAVVARGLMSPQRSNGGGQSSRRSVIMRSADAGTGLRRHYHLTKLPSPPGGVTKLDSTLQLPLEMLSVRGGTPPRNGEPLNSHRISEHSTPRMRASGKGVVWDARDGGYPRQPPRASVQSLALSSDPAASVHSSVHSLQDLQTSLWRPLTAFPWQPPRSGAVAEGACNGSTVESSEGFSDLVHVAEWPRVDKDSREGLRRVGPVAEGMSGEHSDRSNGFSQLRVPVGSGHAQRLPPSVIPNLRGGVKPEQSQGEFSDSVSILWGSAALNSEQANPNSQDLWTPNRHHFVPAGADTQVGLLRTPGVAPLLPTGGSGIHATPPSPISFNSSGSIQYATATGPQEDPMPAAPREATLAPNTVFDKDLAAAGAACAILVPTGADPEDSSGDVEYTVTWNGITRCVMLTGDMDDDLDILADLEADLGVPVSVGGLPLEPAVCSPEATPVRSSVQWATSGNPVADEALPGGLGLSESRAVSTDDFTASPNMRSRQARRDAAGLRTSYSGGVGSGVANFGPFSGEPSLGRLGSNTASAMVTSSGAASAPASVTVSPAGSAVLRPPVALNAAVPKLSLVGVNVPALRATMEARGEAIQDESRLLATADMRQPLGVPVRAASGGLPTNNQCGPLTVFEGCEVHAQHGANFKSHASFLQHIKRQEAEVVARERRRSETMQGCDANAAAVPGSASAGPAEHPRRFDYEAAIAGRGLYKQQNVHIAMLVLVLHLLLVEVCSFCCWVGLGSPCPSLAVPHLRAILHHFCTVFPSCAPMARFNPM
jgi:hypothetical protein